MERREFLKGLVGGGVILPVMKVDPSVTIKPLPEVVQNSLPAKTAPITFSCVTEVITPASYGQNVVLTYTVIR